MPAARKPPPPPKPAPRPPPPAPKPPPPRPAPKPAAPPKPAPHPEAKPAAKPPEKHASKPQAPKSAGAPAQPKPAGKPPAKPAAKPRPKPAGKPPAKPAGRAPAKPKTTAKPTKPGKGDKAPKRDKGRPKGKAKATGEAHVASEQAGGGGGSDVSLGKFESTAYGPPWGGIQGKGITATGIDLRPARHAYIIAVDPSVIRLHTKVTVSPNPFGDDQIVFSAEDVGGGIKGRHIDIYDWRGRSQQYGWGVRTVEVATAQGTGGGEAPAAGGGGQQTGKLTNVYHNPLAHARVTPERIDQGVDYAGTGYLVALADGVVTEVAPGGWGSFGNYIEYKITQPGQLEGAYIFYAEGVTANVHKGQHISGGDKVATLIPGWHSGIEIGFAAGDGGYHTYYHYHDGPYHEGDATRPGIAFSNLIKLLGGPPGHIEGPIVGKWPEYVQNGSYQGITDSGVIPASGGGINFTAGDAQQEANGVDWGASVKAKWHNMQAGGYEGAHHSGSARAFALGKTYVTI